MDRKQGCFQETQVPGKPAGRWTQGQRAWLSGKPLVLQRPPVLSSVSSSLGQKRPAVESQGHSERPLCQPRGVQTCPDSTAWPDAGSPEPSSGEGAGRLLRGAPATPSGM